MSYFKRFSLGPGLIVTAAFIGPGTVTTCTLAGAGYGYTLLWTLLFSGIATYILQEMCGRLGLAGGMGLGEALHHEFPSGIMRFIVGALVVCAVGIGNAAYQTGNLIGASLGLASLVPGSVNLWAPLIGIAAFALLWAGSYKMLEAVFSGLVFLMSLCFIVTAVIIGPDVTALLSGVFIPRLSGESVYIALGLVGTTIVPYNLFLYASVVREKWGGSDDLPQARVGLLIAVAIGTVLSMAIVTTASAAFFKEGTEISDAAGMALQLEPLLGRWARASVAVGLFSAGMTSAMTAPLAAAYAITGVLQRQKPYPSTREMTLKNPRFRAVWAAVLFTGILFASVGLQPVPAILFAQASNGLLLPIAAIFLLYVMNNKTLLGNRVNSWKANSLGAVIIAVTVMLGVRGIIRIF
ncbi:Nramp family divalent metal transporter [candidate division KSB1 bacterium]